MLMIALNRLLFLFAQLVNGARHAAGHRGSLHLRFINFGRLQAHACRIAWVIGVDPIPEGHTCPGQQAARPELRLTALTQPIANQGAFIFGDCAANPQHELVVRALAHRPVQALHPTPGTLQLLDREDLVYIIARESVGRNYVHRPNPHVPLARAADPGRGGADSPRSSPRRGTPARRAAPHPAPRAPPASAATAAQSSDSGLGVGWKLERRSSSASVTSCAGSSAAAMASRRSRASPQRSKSWYA